MIEWREVTELNQVKVGTKLKILGISAKDSYTAITVKRLVKCGSDIEVIINIKKNYYFNLNAYLGNRPMWGKWVDELFYKYE